MTVLEQEMMETIIHCLRSIDNSLKVIAEATKQKEETHDDSGVRSDS